MALVWVSLICLLIGTMLMSYAGSFFLYALALLCALVPAVFYNSKTRMAAILLAIFSVVLLASTYPKFNSEMIRHRISSKTQGVDGQVNNPEETK